MANGKMPQKQPTDIQLNAFIAEKLMGYKWQVCNRKIWTERHFMYNRLYLVSIYPSGLWKGPRKKCRKAVNWYYQVPSYCQNYTLIFAVIEQLKKRQLFNILIKIWTKEKHWEVFVMDNNKLATQINASLPRAICLALYNLYKGEKNVAQKAAK